MKKLVALEKITNSVNRVVYAEKHDQLEFVLNHDDDFAVYFNPRLNQKFITRKKRIAEIEEADVFLFVEQSKQKEKQQQCKQNSSNDKQLNLF